MAEIATETETDAVEEVPVSMTASVLQKAGLIHVDEDDNEILDSDTETDQVVPVDDVVVVGGADNPEGVKKAIEQERKSAREANARARELQAQLKERDEAQLPLEQQVANANAQAAAAKLAALRYEVASETGLDIKLANRLSGTTREELLADAEEFKTYVGSKAALVAPEGGPPGPVVGKNPAREHDNFLLRAIQARQSGAMSNANAFSMLETAPED